MKAMQKGFTLIELIVVIVILGILAATALPRFINVATDARVAAMNGLAGGLRSAVVLAQSRYVAHAFWSGVLRHRRWYRGSHAVYRRIRVRLCCR